MRFVALLRGINVSGKNKIPMAELRSLCEGLGWQNVASYIQSGNLVFESNEKTAELERKLEEAIEKQFDLTIPVIIRSSEQWRSYRDSLPFEAEIIDEAKFVHLLLSKSPPSSSTVDTLTQAAANGEIIRLAGEALWIYFARGVGRSKLTPSKLDKAVGSPVTARNWNTVVKIAEMLGIS